MVSAEYHFVRDDTGASMMAPSRPNSSEQEQESNGETERLTFTPGEYALDTPSTPARSGSLCSSDHSESLELSPASSTQNNTDATTTITPAEQRKRRRTVFLFSTTTVLLFADQNLLSPNLTVIASEFGFSDEERDSKLGGDIALAFFLLGAPASFLIGCLADQSDRSFLFAWTVGIGEGACFATFWTRTYTQLYICLAITGFSIGGAIPLIYSVLGDLFVAEDRHAVSAIIGIGTGMGIAFGQGVAGFLGPTFGWRLPFLVVSTPALICAALVLFTVPDPERGSMERVLVDMREHSMECDENIQQDENGSGIEMKRLKQSDADDDVLHAEASQSGPDTANREFKRRITIEGRYTESRQSEQEVVLPEDSISNGSVGSFSRKDSATSRICGQDWRSHFMTLLSLLSCPTVILTFLQGAPGCLPWGIVNSFLNDFLAEDRGMSVEVSRRYPLRLFPSPQLSQQLVMLSFFLSTRFMEQLPLYCALV